MNNIVYGSFADYTDEDAERDAQKMIDYIQKKNLILAVQKLSELFSLFKQLNILPEDFERDHVQEKGAGHRINDSLRPFIFLVFIENTEKKAYFKRFLKQAIFNGTSAADRMTPTTALKFYHMVLDEFNRIIIDNN